MVRWRVGGIGLVAVASGPPTSAIVIFFVTSLGRIWIGGPFVAIPLRVCRWVPGIATCRTLAIRGPVGLVHIRRSWVPSIVDSGVDSREGLGIRHALRLRAAGWATALGDGWASTLPRWRRRVPDGARGSTMPRAIRWRDDMGWWEVSGRKILSRTPTGGLRARSTRRRVVVHGGDGGRFSVSFVILPSAWLSAVRLALSFERPRRRRSVRHRVG